MEEQFAGVLRSGVRTEDIGKMSYDEERTNKYVRIALDHYNATTKGPKYELVEAIGSNGSGFVSFWFHVCFTAKPIPIASDSDVSPKHFFAEFVKPHGREMKISCCIVDPDSPDTIDGCGSCRPYIKMYHPKGGFEACNYPRMMNVVFD